MCQLLVSNLIIFSLLPWLPVFYYCYYYLVYHRYLDYLVGQSTNALTVNFAANLTNFPNVNRLLRLCQRARIGLLCCFFLFSRCFQFFPRVKRQGRVVNHTLHIQRRGQRKTRAVLLFHLWGFQGLFQGDFIFPFIVTNKIMMDSGIFEVAITLVTLALCRN